MIVSAGRAKPRGPAAMLTWRRLLFTVCASLLPALVLMPGWTSGSRCTCAR